LRFSLALSNCYSSDWSESVSYMSCENASANAYLQIRFLDDLDISAGVTVKVTF